MINIKEFPIFTRSICSLKETSKDENDSTIEYLSESLAKVINFDKVKQEYTSELEHSEDGAKSVDAISLCGEDLYFIEFKNGKIETAERKNIRQKISDSLLLFCDITKKNISYTRNNINFILVYNYEKNKNKCKNIQPSLSREKIIKTLSSKSKQDIIYFDLEKVKSLYFKEVFTYTIEEFYQKYLPVDII